MSYIAENIAWIESGKIGCVFASALVKQRDKIGWKFYVSPELAVYRKDLEERNIFIASVIFPSLTLKQVREIALNSGMYIEDISGLYEGLRMRLGSGNISWVQYFGPDSHVKTRQSPHPMLSFTVKLPTHIYAKTMIKGIYHLAHASIEHLSNKKSNTLWEQSFAKTKKELGHSPTLAEAAKVTFIK